MKTLHFSIIVIFIICSIAGIGTVYAYGSDGGYLITTPASNSTQAENTNEIEIQNIQVQPSVITIGGKFSISATLVNNSTNPIYVETNDCTGMFSVIFDNHVKVEPKERACTYMLLIHMMNPGEKFTGINPPSGVTYSANATGTANATVTFSYGMRNQTDPNSSSIEKTISKSILFTIYGNNVVVKAVNETPLPPLEQFKSGIPVQDVKCNQGLQLIFKAEDRSPACVTPDAAQILIEREWALNYTNMVDTESISLSAYQGVSNEAFYNNGTVASNFTIDVNIKNFVPSDAPLVLQVYYNDGILYKTVNVSSDMIQPDGFYKYQLTAVSDENHPVPFKVVVTYNNETAIAYAPVFAHP